MPPIKDEAQQLVSTLTQHLFDEVQEIRQLRATSPPTHMVHSPLVDKELAKSIGLIEGLMQLADNDMELELKATREFEVMLESLFKTATDTTGDPEEAVDAARELYDLCFGASEYPADGYEEQPNGG